MKLKKNKTIYLALSIDILHEGHINILKIASKYGRVIVGLLTDKAILEYKQIPYLDFETRKRIISNLKYVDNVVAQDSKYYTKNLIKLRPDYVIHGDNWKTGILKGVRKEVIKTLKKWGGKLVEPKFTKKIKYSEFKKKLLEVGTTPEVRKFRFKRILQSKDVVRIIEGHSAISALIAEKSSLETPSKFMEFDAIWSSSLTDSVLRGKPDNQSVDYSTRLNGLNEILEVTTKPVVFDADNGGRVEHLVYLVKNLERMGISAICLEDKIGLKKNSLFQNQSGSMQDSIRNFSKKIKCIKDNRISDNFLIIARVESLILGKTVDHALKRANAYSKAGADLILIHSKDTSPKNIFSFSKKFSKSKYFKDIVIVPSTYNHIKENQFKKNKIKCIIYANQLMRASYKSMKETALNILKNQRSYEVSKKITSISEIINLIK